MNYLVEQSLGSIIRATFEIYRRHFVTLILVYMLPILPFVILWNEAIANDMPLLATVAFLGLMLASIIGFASITVVVSDVCLGNRPSVRRSFDRAFGKLIGRLLVTGLLQGLIMLAGLILLVVPAFVFMIWFMFAQAIVILEGSYGWNALKRSKALGSGHHWRNAGVMAVMLAILMAIGMLLGLGEALLGHLLSLEAEHWSFRTAQAVLNVAVAYPLSYVAMALTYYDLRVRKEGYDAEALLEELAR